jgi:hypothetical protein
MKKKLKYYCIYGKNLLLHLTVCNATFHVSDITSNVCFIVIFALFLSHTEGYSAHMSSVNNRLIKLQIPVYNHH